MKIRQLKKILKEFPPILVITYPYSMNIEDVMNLKRAIQSLYFNKKYEGWKIFLIEGSEPLKLLDNNIKEEQIKEFRKSWEEVLKNNVTPILSFEDIEINLSPKLVEFISPFKIPIWLYKSKVQKIENMIEESKREESKRLVDFGVNSSCMGDNGALKLMFEKDSK